MSECEQRYPPQYTWVIFNAIHNGSLGGTEYAHFPAFNLGVAISCQGAPSTLLNAAKRWQSPVDGFRREMVGLARLF